MVLGRDVGNRERLAERLLVEDVLLTFDDVEVTGEQFARTHGELERLRALGQPVVNHRDATLEIRTDAIHLVREDHTRDGIAVGLTPHRFRLRLDAGDGIEQRHRAVEHAQ